MDELKTLNTLLEQIVMNPDEDELEQLKIALERVSEYLQQLEGNTSENLSSLTEEIDNLKTKIENLKLEKGDKGDSYVLTKKDQKEIADLAAKLITIPIVEKEIIKEVPIVTENVVQVAVPESAEVIIDKIGLDSKLDDLKDEFKKELENKIPQRSGVGGIPGLLTYASGVKKGFLKAINFAGATHSVVNGLDTLTVGSSLTATTELWIDGNRSDSYTADGSISKPFKTISAAIAGSVIGGYQGFSYHIAPATYIESSNLTFPNISTTIHANNAVIVIQGGGGTATFPSSFDIYGLTITGSVLQTDTSTTTIHNFVDGVITGTLTTSGLTTLTNHVQVGAITNQTGAVLFIGNSNIQSTITNAAGGTVNIGSANVGSTSLTSTAITNSGTMHINGVQTTANVAGYAIVSTTAGSVVYMAGDVVINPNASGHGVDIRNGADGTPGYLVNEIALVDVILNGNASGIPFNAGLGAPNRTTNGPSVTALDNYNATNNGTTLYATGANFVGQTTSALNNVGTYRDHNHSPGVSGYFLSSTSVGTLWVPGQINATTDLWDGVTSFDTYRYGSDPNVISNGFSNRFYWDGVNQWLAHDDGAGVFQQFLCQAFIVPTSGGTFGDLRTSAEDGGVRVISTQNLTTTPGGAAIQVFNNNSVFLGQAYIDTGANDNAYIAFRSCGTGGTIANRVLIKAAGQTNFVPVAAPASLSNGDLWTDSTQKSIFAYQSGVKQADTRTLFTQTADKTVSNTVTETTILGTGVGTLTLPADFFVAGKTVRLRVGGIYSTPALATPSIVIKVKYGSTVIATVTTSALLSGATNLEFDGEVAITCRTAGSSGTVMVHGDIEYATGVAGTIAVDPLNNAGATTTINTTTSNALDVTVTWDTATSTRSVKSTVSLLEILN